MNKKVHKKHIIGSLLLSLEPEIRMYQLDHIPDYGLEWDLPEGNYACDQLHNVWLKKGPKSTDWQRDTKKVMFLDVLDWAYDFLMRLSSEFKNRIVDTALEGIEVYKGGKKSKKGTETAELLTKDCDFIGVCPNIVYMLSETRGERGDTDVLWQHPFSETTLLFKHKEYPILILSNGNLDYNDSRLNKNKFNDESFPIIGISG